MTDTGKVKLGILNFEALKGVKITLDGVTCIIGINNSGKTSTIRSIDALITGNIPAGKVREGTEKALIGIEAKGHKVILAREKSCMFQVDGKPFDKIGRSTSVNDVCPEMGLLETEVQGAGKIHPQISFAKTPPFPFGLTEGQCYTVFARFFGMGKLEDLIDEFKTERKQIGTLIKTLDDKIDLRTTDRTNLEAQISIIPNKASRVTAREDILELTKKIRIYQEAERLQARLLTLSERRNDHQVRVVELKKAIKGLEKLITEVEEHQAKHTALTQYDLALDNCASKRANLEKSLANNKAEMLSINEQRATFDTCSICGSAKEHWDFEGDK